MIAEDVVPKCGPLGGIITALEQTKAERIVFLPCDMPFIGAELIRDVISVARNTIHVRCVHLARRTGLFSDVFQPGSPVRHSGALR